MRSGGALLLLTFLAVAAAAAAEDSTNVLPAETNDHNTVAQSGVGDKGQLGETNANREPKVRKGTGSNNGTAEINKKDNSAQGEASTRRDEPVQQPKDKDNNTTEFPISKDLSQDPLIKCDSSHKCTIQKEKFIACLTVPGEDSSALSLLVGNKGTSALDVRIMSPDYVHLIQDTVHVEANSHDTIKMRVSNSDAANKTVIVLKVAGGNCTIDIQRAITGATAPVARMRFTSTFMLVPVFVLLGLVGVCIKLRRVHKQEGIPTYQKLDTSVLPVSTGGKKEVDQSDQWDDNWGDDWDDVEAPVTPSKPMPNPSSKGLSSRRLPKDGWKD